jgi:hypothetical protein
VDREGFEEGEAGEGMICCCCFFYFHPLWHIIRSSPHINHMHVLSSEMHASFHLSVCLFVCASFIGFFSQVSFTLSPKSFPSLHFLALTEACLRLSCLICSSCVCFTEWCFHICALCFSFTILCKLLFVFFVSQYPLLPFHPGLLHTDECYQNRRIEGGPGVANDHGGAI